MGWLLFGMLAFDAGGLAAFEALSDYEFEAGLGLRGARWNGFRSATWTLITESGHNLLCLVPAAGLSALLFLGACRLLRRRSTELALLGPNWGFGWLSFLGFHFA